MAEPAERFQVVLTTAGSDEQARAIAGELVRASPGRLRQRASRRLLGLSLEG